MARGSAYCTCEICKNGFVHHCEAENVEELEKDIDWFSKHNCICPTCFQKIKKRELLLAIQRVEELFPDLPIIQGSSEHQIAYANHLRTKFVEKYLFLCLSVQEMIHDEPDRIVRILKKEEYPTFEESYTIPEITCAYLVFKNNQASILIDMIRNTTYL